MVFLSLAANTWPVWIHGNWVPRSGDFQPASAHAGERRGAHQQRHRQIE
jgi:hypothetical protein